MVQWVIMLDEVDKATRVNLSKLVAKLLREGRGLSDNKSGGN